MLWQGRSLERRLILELILMVKSGLKNLSVIRIVVERNVGFLISGIIIIIIMHDS